MSTPTPSESAAYALVLKGDMLRDAGKADEVLAAYAQACDAARTEVAQQPHMATPLASALMSTGLLQGAAGHCDEALRAFDEIVARFGPSDAGMQEEVAHARYNRAVTLRDAGRRPEAAQAYQRVVDDYAASADAATQRFAALAAYNKALMRVHGGEIDEALRDFQAMDGLFTSSTDPVVRERVAKGLYFAALLAEEAGDLPGAGQACARIASRFKDDENETVRRVVAGSRRHARIAQGWSQATFDGASAVVDLDPTLLLAMEQSDGNVVHDILHVSVCEPELRSAPFSLQESLHYLRVPLPEVPADADGQAQETAAKVAQMMRHLERDVAAHLRCGDVLRRYLVHGEPFGLVLRNFDVEGYKADGSEGGRALRAYLLMRNEPRLEASIAADPDIRLPFIAVNNNAPVHPIFQPGIPRLALRNEDWQQVVEELIGAATVIVVSAAYLTRGLLWELRTIERIGAQDRTLVVLAKPDTEQSMARLAEQYYGARRAVHRPFDTGTPELAAFARIVHESDLPARVSTAPCMAELLQRVEAPRAAAEERWDGVVF